MAKLECEICGGRLIMSGDGILQCEACGSCYSKDWARTKVQEITGTVQVDGVATVESLLKRAQEYFDVQDYAKAIEYCNRALDVNPNHDAARELRKLSTDQMAEDVKVFQTYEAVVTEISQFECVVQLTKSGKVAHVHTSQISDPPPKRIADVVAIGDSVRVTIISDSTVGRANERYLCASLLPPEALIGYYLQYPSIGAMKESLIHLKAKFSSKMIGQAEGELRKLRGHPDISLSSNAIEDRIERCELLLAKALHDNPDCAIEIPLEAGPTGWNVNITSWKTTEMQAEARRIWEMGQPAAEILNDSRFSYLLLRFLSPPAYFFHDWDRKESRHTEYYDDEDSVTTTLHYRKFAFAYGRAYFNNTTWGWFPFSLPDIEVLNCWYANYRERKCFAGGSLSFWLSQSSICHCTTEQCHIDNPECPLRNTFHQN